MVVLFFYLIYRTTFGKPKNTRNDFFAGAAKEQLIKNKKKKTYLLFMFFVVIYLLKFCVPYHACVLSIFSNLRVSILYCIALYCAPRGAAPPPLIPRNIKLCAFF